jgi:hypothetical protein
MAKLVRTKENKKVTDFYKTIARELNQIQPINQTADLDDNNFNCQNQNCKKSVSYCPTFRTSYNKIIFLIAHLVNVV